MTDLGRPLPPDPHLTPEQQIMIDIGWLDLWHADRDAAQPIEDASPSAPRVSLPMSVFGDTAIATEVISTKFM